MCTSPITVYNKSRRISLNSFMPSVYRVPCGQCCECKALKRSEWLFRIQKEYQNCIAAGGCALFDTLTYSNDTVPYLSRFDERIKWTYWDRYCFDKKDTQDFFKRLRHKADFRYIIVSEYGTHPAYSHRPHYHVLFFLPKQVDPLLFSEYVSDCWQHGRTDGVKYKGSLYVYNRRVYRGNTPEIMNIISYVSKYVTKSEVEDAKLRKRIDNIMRTFYGEHWRRSYKYVNEYNNLLGKVSQFHNQSLDFGALSYVEQIQAIQNDCIVGFSQDGPMKLPIYRSYRRKWFYDKLNWNGFEYWQLNDLGLKYELKKYVKKRDLISLRLQSLYISSPEDVQTRFDKLRITFNQLAEYELAVRGRIGMSYCKTPEELYFDSLIPDYSDSVFNVSSRYDRIRFGRNGWSWNYVPFCQDSKYIVENGVLDMHTVIPDIKSYDILPFVNHNPEYDNVLDTLYDVGLYYSSVKEQDAQERAVQHYRMKKAGMLQCV